MNDEPQDALDEIWVEILQRRASYPERRMILAFEKILDVEHPFFPLIMAMVATLYETMGETEKAVFRLGPALQAEMVTLSSNVQSLGKKLTDVEQSLANVNRSAALLQDTHSRLNNLRAWELSGEGLPAWLVAAGASLVTVVALLVATVIGILLF